MAKKNKHNKVATKEGYYMYLRRLIILSPVKIRGANLLFFLHVFFWIFISCLLQKKTWCPILDYSNCQNSIISFDYSWFLAKNSTTSIAIAFTPAFSGHDLQRDVLPTRTAASILGLSHTTNMYYIRVSAVIHLRVLTKLQKIYFYHSQIDGM